MRRNAILLPIMCLLFTLRLMAQETPAAPKEAQAGDAKVSAAAEPAQGEKEKPETESPPKRPWNVFFDNKKFSMRLNMCWLFDVSLYSQDGNNAAQVGNLDNKYDLRAGRIILDGLIKFHHPWTYIVGANYNGIDRPPSQKNFAFTDLAVGIPLGDFATMSIGKQREGVSQIMQMVGTGSPFMERATITTALLPTRNVGVVFFHPILKDRMTWSAGWFNSWIESGHIRSFSANGNQFVGRANGLLVDRDQGAELVELGVAYRYSDAQDGKFHFRSKGEDNAGPNFVDTGSFPAEYSNTVVLQGATVTGPFSLQAEYLHTAVEAPTVGNPRFQGYYFMASYFLTGEHRVYNRKGGFFLKTPPKSPFSFKDTGGPGAWELGLGYSVANLNNRGIQGGDFRRTTAAISWYATERWRFEFNYGLGSLNKGAITGRADVYQFRIQWDL
jgi:phosphate-selective porin OprO and OprP